MPSRAVLHVETAIGGKVATEVLDGPRRFDVVVRPPRAAGAAPAGRSLSA